jgi:hypothetical protein
MAIPHITGVFSGATISSFDLTIPSGSLVSCSLPATGTPTEIIFGLLETMHQAIATGDPTYISSSAASTLLDASTYRRTYSFTVDLAFDNTTILGLLNVKAEPA